MKHIEKIASLISIIPSKTGVYQYFDKNSNLIYIGKAKNLKKRVSSYFKQTHSNKKTKKLVATVCDIKYILVETEIDALLLENNLIKKHQPKYNIVLKDDKTYPWICVKKEPFPRIFQTRKLIQDGSLYFGPYTSIKLVKLLLDFAHELYPLRTCNLSLNQKNILKNKFTVCLEFHLKNCLGPCENKQTKSDYQSGIDHITKILSGDINSVIKHFQKAMMRFSEKREFEKAQSIKEKILLLKKYQAKSMVVRPDINNVDVFSVVSNSNVAVVNYLNILNGAIVHSHCVTTKKKLDESDKKILELAIIDLRARFKNNSKLIFSSHIVDNIPLGVKIKQPKIGDKKKLVALSLRNAKQLLLEHEKRNASKTKKSSAMRVLDALKNDLSLPFLPVHIECFDNSNTQGSAPVSSCVVFKNGLPDKKKYRFFNIKTVSGIDDYASIEEVVFRRYKSVLKKNMPHLIVIDGGRGQLNAASKSLKKLALEKSVTIIGIAKKLETIYLSEDSVPLFLDKKSESLKLIQRIRNEAHRFAIKNHRNKRDKLLLKSALDGIPGVGVKTISLLISRFGSVKNISKKKQKELEEVVGKKKALVILSYLN